MSKHEEQGEQEQPKPSDSKVAAGYSMTDLQALAVLVAQAMKGVNEGSNDKLAEAILKSREPYEKPQDKANRESARRSMIKSREDQQRAIKFNQEKVCKHVQGSNANSTRRSTDSAFFQMVLDTGETIGVCSNCQKVISSMNQEDYTYFQMGGGNVRAAAGYADRFFADPLKAQRARLGLDQRELVLDETTGDLVEKPTAEELAAKKLETVPAE